MTDQPTQPRKPGRPPIYGTDAEREAARQAADARKREKYLAKVGQRVAVQIPAAEAKLLAAYGPTPLEGIRALLRLARAKRRRNPNPQPRPDLPRGQREVLDAMARHFRERMEAPTRRDLAEALGVAVNTVQERLRLLVAKRYVEIKAKTERGLSITTAGFAALAKVNTPAGGE